MEDISKSQIEFLEMKTVRLEIKKHNVFNSRLYIRKKISELEDTAVKFWREKIILNEKSISELWENFQWPNVHIIGVPKRQRFRKIFKEIMTQDLPNLITISPQIQVSQQIQSPKNMMKTPSKRIIIKLFKTSTKEKASKATTGGKKKHHVQRNKDKTSFQKQCMHEDNRATALKYWKKKLPT